MSRLIKSLTVVLVAVFMFLCSAMSPVKAESVDAGEDQPEPASAVEAEPAAEEVSEEIPAETAEEISEEETPAEETIIEEAEEEGVPEAEISVEEIVEEEAEPELEFIDFDGGNTSEINAVSDAPATAKKLFDNGDGTYTLSLSVTGEAASSSTTEVTKANVILVIDTSNSMVNNNTTYEGSSMTRLAAEKRVLTDDGGIIDSLLAQNVAGDPVKSDIIEIAIANFGTRGSTAQSFTTNAATLKTTINGLTNTQGTNWEEGLMRAQELARDIKSSQSDEEVYIIFLTDGEPTTHYNDYTVNTNFAQEWAQANDNARAIVTAGYHFYGIFTWGSGTSSHYLSSLVQYAYTGSGDSNTALNPAYAQYFTDATDTDTLIQALTQIVHDITESVGYTNVELEDGVTSMTTSSVKATAAGEVTGLKYYRSGGTYGTADPDNGNYGTEWTEAPHATINDKGEVDWDLGNIVLEDGVTYTVTFVVWPSQESLDLVADLNNGLVDYNTLSDDEKSQIFISGGKYVLKTNTDYPQVTYSTVTTTTVDGVPTTVVSDPKTATIQNPDPVGLAGSEMTIRKIWSVDLQSWRLDGLLYNDDGSSKKLTVALDVFKESKLYETVELGWDPTADDGNGAYIWADPEETIWEEDFAVAPGVMTTNAEMAEYAKSTITFEGKTYYILETGHDYEIKENDFKDYHFDLVTVVYHPMLVDGELKTIKAVYEGEGENRVIKSIEAMDNLSSLEATNTLRGGINLNKVVVDADGNVIESADEFEFTIALTNEKEVFVGDSIPWFSVNGNYYHDDDGNYISEDEAKKMYGDDYEKHGNVLSGTSTAVSTTLYITAADTVRIANVPVGTTYTITEAENTAYTLTKIDQEIQLSDGTDKKPGTGTVTLDERKIVGEIVPDRENNVTYTNTAKPVFYVYHSSDNTIERIGMDDARIINGKFNLVNETKSGYIYGGYYKAYGGQKLNDAAIKALAYANTDDKTYEYTTKAVSLANWAQDDIEKDDEDEVIATPYTGAKATAWKKGDAYTAEKGNAMTPANGTVYYLKEVPDGYLRPYIQIVYDERTNPKNKIVKLFRITACDDANYTEIGFNDGTNDASKTQISSTIKITSDYDSSKNVTLTAKNIFNGKEYDDKSVTVPRGYLTSIQNSFASNFDMRPFFKTLDGVKVYGVTNRTVMPGDGYYNTEGGIKVKDATEIKLCE